MSDYLAVTLIVAGVLLYGAVGSALAMIPVLLTGQDWTCIPGIAVVAWVSALAMVYFDRRGSHG